MIRTNLLLAAFFLTMSSSMLAAQSRSIDDDVAYCEEYYGNIDAKRYADVAASVETSGELKSLAYELKYKQKERRECLEPLREGAKSDPASLKRLDAMLGSNDKTMVDRFAVAKAEFEANVVKYLDPALYFGKPDIAPYKAALVSTRNVPSFRSACGTFDLSYVPVESRAVDAARARHEAFKACFDKFTDRAAQISVNEFGSYQVAAQRLAGTLPYTCSRWAKPNCVPDENWKRFGGELFTQKNRAAVDAAEERLKAETDLAYETDRRVSEWVRELSARIRAANGN